MAARKRRLSERASARPEKPKHAENLSAVEVEFIDGEVRTYTITASYRIGSWLAREASDNGVLTLFNDEQSVSVPISQVRTYTIRPIPLEDSKESDHASEAQPPETDAGAEDQAEAGVAG